MSEAPQPGLRDADLRGCRWIEGEPTPLRPGMFCCARCLPGSPWCAKHRKIVWGYQRAPRNRIGSSWQQPAEPVS
jgi:hypothetical protein